MKIRTYTPLLAFICILNNFSLAQGQAVDQRSMVGDRHIENIGVKNYLALTPEFEAARQADGWVTIPFTVKNTSSFDVVLGSMRHHIDGLAILDQDGNRRFLGEYVNPGVGEAGGGMNQIFVLKPGETSSILSAYYGSEILTRVSSMKVFGVLTGYIKEKNQEFESWSQPFIVPKALTVLPWEDLGAQSFLAIQPELSDIYFQGGSFKFEIAKMQQSEPNYAESIANGWARSMTIPCLIKNESNRDVAIAIDEVDFVLVGDEQEQKRLVRSEREEYLKASSAVLKPGDSISTEASERDYITLRVLENQGYKLGDKMVAIVGGRILNTNQIFQCYSAPFELPPIPKGEPPSGQ